jgi:hypothetical protein
MSAERDNQQGMTFIYSNFYQLYRQGKIEADSRHEPVAKGKILKVHSRTETPVPAQVCVASQEQTAEWAQWAAGRDSSTEASKINGVREHLRSLREAKARLKFLTQELDEILKRSGS